MNYRAGLSVSCLILICFLSIGYFGYFDESKSLGTTYYISPFGDDRAVGTSPHLAWQTLGRANLHAFQPGDTLLLQGGETFEGQLTIDPERTGTPDDPLVIGSYGPVPAIIAPKDSHALWLNNCGGIVVENLVLKGAGQEQHRHTGIILTSVLPSENSKHQGIKIRHVSISGFGEGGITLWVGDSAAGYRDVEISYVNLQANGDHGINLGSAKRTNASTLEDIYIHHCLAAHHPGLPDKTWSHTGNGIVVGQADRVRIEHCEAHHNGANNTHDGGPVGIWLWDCHEGVIQYCHAHHNRTNSTADGGGFDLDGGCQHCVMQHNLSHDNDGAGYLVAAYQGANPTYHCTVQYNYSLRDGQANAYGGISIWRADSAELDSIRVVGNTVLSLPHMDAEPAGFDLFSGQVEQVEVSDNLFLYHPNAYAWRIRPAEWKVSFRDNAWVCLGDSVEGRGIWQDSTYLSQNWGQLMETDWRGNWPAPVDTVWQSLSRRRGGPWTEKQ